MSRWAWAEVSPAAIEHNVRTLCADVQPAELWAVVKADGNVALMASGIFIKR